ncbi:hypothetical protein LCGC14_0921040 [marine sediment metagenome]|uniref:Uncharacterized protein n=1 Tax=marine sediment metagenome TaxID=412755 RepID=A0A0F9NQY9_9ZZZZ
MVSIPQTAASLKDAQEKLLALHEDARAYLAQPMTKCEAREGELVAALEAVQGDISYFELEDETQGWVDAALGEKA